MTPGTSYAPYARIADWYAGDGPEEDDPHLRATGREAFRSRLRGRRVLEVGCGPGTDAARLMEMGLEVTATDGCARFIEIARTRFPALEARVMDMTRPDLPAASFDGIYGFACFIHLPRAEAAPTLRELRALLAPGGLLFLALIESSKLREYVIDDWGGLPGNPALFTCHPREEMRQMLLATGFEDVELLRPPPSPLYDTLPRLVERGVTSYWVAARHGGSGSRNFTLP